MSVFFFNNTHTPLFIPDITLFNKFRQLLQDVERVVFKVFEVPEDDGNVSDPSRILSNEMSF